MGEIPDGADRFADIRFPIHGVDVSEELESQRPGTTPLGGNVRGFECITFRLRGGSRCGLSKFLNDKVAEIPLSDPQPIQNLTLVIDPAGALIPFPFDNVAGETFDNLDPSNLGRNLLFDGSIGDVYDGGSGFLPNKKARPVPKVTITPTSFNKNQGTTYTFTGTEFTTDDGITNYRSYTASAKASAQTASEQAASKAAAADEAAANDPGSEALAAYATALHIAAAKAAAAFAGASVLNDKAQAAAVNLVELSSPGSEADADAGIYPINGKNATGINLDLFRIRYGTGALTVVEVSNEVTIILNGVPTQVPIGGSGLFSFSSVLHYTQGPGGIDSYYKLVGSGHVASNAIDSAGWQLFNSDVNGNILPGNGTLEFADATFSPGTPYTAPTPPFPTGVYYTFPTDQFPLKNLPWTATFGSAPAGLRTSISLIGYFSQAINLPNLFDTFYFQPELTINASMSL